MKFYSRLEAKERIKEIIASGTPIKTGLKIPIRYNKSFNSYSLPIDILVPNVKNDRIASQVREYESINHLKLSHDNEEHVNYVFELLENEKKSENEATLKDLADKGQMVDAIITKDGVVIDGNRRFTLLRKLFHGEAAKFKQPVERFRFINAIILEEDIQDNEILALETQIQIGENRKVDYNPINIYIKVDNLLKAGYNESMIASYMNVEISEVKDKIAIFRVMNDYLNFINKVDHYTLLDGLEDQFIKTKNLFKKLDNNSYQVDWNYTDDDITNFKGVCYDYLRSKFEGKKYRDLLIGGTNKADGVFMDEKVWKDFYVAHEKTLRDLSLINEEDWKSQQVVSTFEGNLKRAQKALEDKKIDKNISTLIDVIDQKISNLSALLDEINDLGANDYSKLANLSKKVFELKKKFE
jgi:hypothetical protein